MRPRLLKKKVRLDVEKYCFEIMICAEWNRLHRWVENAGKLNVFSFLFSDCSFEGVSASMPGLT